MIFYIKLKWKFATLNQIDMVFHFWLICSPISSRIMTNKFYVVQKRFSVLKVLDKTRLTVVFFSLHYSRSNYSKMYSIPICYVNVTVTHNVMPNCKYYLKTAGGITACCHPTCNLWNSCRIYVCEFSPQSMSRCLEIKENWIKQKHKNEQAEKSKPHWDFVQANSQSRKRGKKKICVQENQEWLWVCKLVCTEQNEISSTAIS